MNTTVYFIKLGALFYSADRNAFVMKDYNASSYSTAEIAFTALDDVAASFPNVPPLGVVKAVTSTVYSDVQRAA